MQCVGVVSRLKRNAEVQGRGGGPSELLVWGLSYGEGEVKMLEIKSGHSDLDHLAWPQLQVSSGLGHRGLNPGLRPPLQKQLETCKLAAPFRYNSNLPFLGVPKGLPEGWTDFRWSPRIFFSRVTDPCNLQSQFTALLEKKNDWKSQKENAGHSVLMKSCFSREKGGWNVGVKTEVAGRQGHTTL